MKRDSSMTHRWLWLPLAWGLIGLVGCEGQHVPPPTVSDTNAEDESRVASSPNAVSLLGTPLFSPVPSIELLAKLEQHRNAFESDPGNPDALIWYGRFTAYAGDYEAAIELFVEGARQFPNDPRMLRHAGHRYITVRKFDQAIEVLERAAAMIQGQENQVEPDGMPNPQNIPVSTLHGNIWYHLGLAYYLKHDFKNALRAYRNCLQTAKTPDNVVSATHWIYMIHRRMGADDDATESLESIQLEMEVIENTGYHLCCCFYKGLIPMEEIESAILQALHREALEYAIGNWHFYNGDPGQARVRWNMLNEKGAWNSFGLIAAESELAGETLEFDGRQSVD